MAEPLFSRTTYCHDMGQRAAIIYSLVASCKLSQIDPFAYLRDVIERVNTHPAKHIAELTPRGRRESYRDPIIYKAPSRRATEPDRQR